MIDLVALAGSTALVDFFRPWPHARPTAPLAHVQNAMAVRQASDDFGASIS